MSRPTPREILGLGGNKRKIIDITLEEFHYDVYVSIVIGDPPIEQKLHLDTGSDLSWVVHNPELGYDPLRSSSFSYRSCAGISDTATVLKRTRNGHCSYKQSLGDKSVYEGILGTETFSFRTGDGGLGTYNNMLFGFGQTTVGVQLGEGTLGLSLGGLSILEKFGNKFSICMDRSTVGQHFLALGDDAVLGGRVISLNTDEDHYFVNLRSVVINGNSFGTENGLFEYNAVLDTGSSAIFLVTKLYRLVIDDIMKKMRVMGYLRSYRQTLGLLCYEDKIPEPEELKFTLKFDEEIVEIITTVLFTQFRANYFCLSVAESPYKKNIMGLQLFRGHNIGFDIPNNKVYIKDSECHKLKDDYKDELDHPNP